VFRSHGGFIGWNETHSKRVFRKPLLSSIGRYFLNTLEEIGQPTSRRSAINKNKNVAFLLCAIVRKGDEAIST
jgi:hypothetical protein